MLHLNWPQNGDSSQAFYPSLSRLIYNHENENCLYRSDPPELYGLIGSAMACRCPAICEGCEYSNNIVESDSDFISIQKREVMRFDTNEFPQHFEFDYMMVECQRMYNQN